jgi:molybdate transport system regulatory protein
MKISAETRYPDFIRKVEESAVNAEVTIELAAGLNITSIVTHEAVHSLGIDPDMRAYAVIKACGLMASVDD